MLSHGPKRVYTPQSLEFWFGRLENDWSGAFTSNQLEEGRRIYRDGEVRELELTATDAIVHRRIEKKDEYAVIEWGSEGLSVRSSTTDLDMAHALAVAGLHEIEELVVDEIDPLPGELPGLTHGEATGERAIEIGPGGKAPAGGAGGGPAAPSGPSRALLLVFKTKAAGLTFQAF